MIYAEFEGKKKKTTQKCEERLQRGFIGKIKKKKRKVANELNPVSPASFCALGKDPPFIREALRFRSFTLTCNQVTQKRKNNEKNQKIQLV